MRLENIPTPEHYVETVVPEDRAPPVTEVGPLGWLYKNLFSTWYNTILTILSILLILWAINGLAVWVIGQANWGVIINNLRTFGTGRYPTEDKGRVDLYLVILTFLAGMTWQLWGRAQRAVIAVIVIAVVMIFALPFLGAAMTYPPSYVLVSPQRSEPVPAMAFVAEEGQTITYTLTPVDDFAEMPVGFMDNTSLTTAGLIQLEIEAAERAAAAAEATEDATEETAEVEPAEVETLPPIDLQATLTVYDQDLNTLETLTVAAQDGAPGEIEVTFPYEGWYVLQIAPEGETGAMWLSIEGFEPMKSATEEAEKRVAIYGPAPQLEDTRNRALDISYLIAFSGVRTFEHFMSVYIGPMASALQWGVLTLVLALFAGYGVTFLARRVIDNRPAPPPKGVTLRLDTEPPPVPQTTGAWSALARLRGGIAGLFSQRAALILWGLMFPLLFLLIRGITPGELVGMIQALAIAVCAVTVFMFLAGIIPERFRPFIERYIVLPLLAGAWVAVGMIAVYLLGPITIVTPSKIFTTSWDVVSTTIMPNVPRLTLDAIGYVAIVLIPVLVATISYLAGRSSRDNEKVIGGAGFALATSTLILAMIAIFLGGVTDLTQLTIAEGLTFLLFSAVVVGILSAIYLIVLWIWPYLRSRQPSRTLVQVAVAMLVVAVVVGALAVWLSDTFRIPGGGVVTFVDPPYESASYVASVSLVPEVCDPEDNTAFLFGAAPGDSANYYAFNVRCGGHYSLVQHTGAGFGEPLFEGQLSRPMAVGSNRAQPVSVAVADGKGAAWWGKSLLGEFEIEERDGQTAFGFALEPGAGRDNQQVSFLDFGVWSLPEDLAELAELNPEDDLGDPALQLRFVAKETNFTVAQLAAGATVETFGDSLVFDVPKLLQRTEIVTLVDVDLWGGLLLTMVLTVIGNVASFPIGIALALGRRSDLPVVRVFCTLFIEFVRGVPLVTVLFMANLFVPLLEPSLQTVPNVLRAMIGMTLFNAAYVAETVRGGLQAIPRGQYEAAYALGMNAFLMNVRIILPQALRLVIPAMVGQFISLFKDTSLAFIIGLIELLGVSRTVITQAEYIGLQRETFLFAAVIYFVISYAMSYASRRIEESGSGAVRRT